MYKKRHSRQKKSAAGQVQRRGRSRKQLGKWRIWNIKLGSAVLDITLAVVDHDRSSRADAICERQVLKAAYHRLP